ncbi:DNA recombination protein RmuC [Candidatus Endomicrobiellum trichonymphae]|uniref:DNA recombination protein RmuC n=1 Tax=Endomicrobium trichonymphae TaxID=1408204 RepID=UPI0039B95407
MNTTISIFLFLSGIAAGICLFAFKYIPLSKDNAAKEQKINNLKENIENQTQLSNNLKIEFENIASKVSEEKNANISLSKDNAAKEQKIHDLKENIENQMRDNAAKEQKINDLTKNIENLSKDNAAKEQKINNLKENIENQTQFSNNLKIEFENIASKNIENQTQLSSNLKTEFENIALKVLEEKNAKITDLNRISLENIVFPFKEKIDEFRNKIDNLQTYEAEKMSGLQKELEKLISINNSVSAEAKNLANALKGDNKLQGTWGEMCLERIFEHAGMTKDVHYESQKQFKADDGKKIPDYIVKLPDGKHIVIDAKTSLVAYEKYYNTQNEDDKKNSLKEHSSSVKRHIDELATKDYISLPGLNQPEYALMFVPLDGAISIALDDKPDLIEYAFKKNIAIVTPSTLLATLKTIQYIWRQENQKKNVIEIAKQGGSLYDNFVTFVEVLREADKKISEAKSKTQEAIKRLSASDKKGNSLIAKAQRLKDLGSPTKKEIPEDLLKNGDKNDAV